NRRRERVSFQLSRHAALPRNEVCLAVAHGAHFQATGHLNNVVQDALAGLFDGFFAINHGAGIQVDDVGHALGQLGVRADFDNRCDGVAGGRAEASGEKYYVGPRAYFSSRAFHIVAGGAEQVEAGFGHEFGIVEHGHYRRRTTLASCPRRFHGVRNQAIANIAGRGVHIEARAHGDGAVAIRFHERGKALSRFVVYGAVHDFLLYAAQLRELGQDN
nr:hypothetical protein [Tanacetum cinerariifolium]